MRSFISDFGMEYCFYLFEKLALNAVRQYIFEPLRTFFFSVVAIALWWYSVSVFVFFYRS